MSTMTYPGQSDSRLLAWCIGGSMLLHALIMWQGHGVKSDSVPTAEIRVNIRAAAPPAPAAQPRPEPPKPEPPTSKPPTPEPPKPEPARAQPQPEPPPKTPDRLARPEPKGPAPEPRVAVPQPVPPSAPAAPSPENRSEAKSESAKAAPAPAPAAPSASSAADADDAALVRSYQLQLAQVTNKYKVYPRVALDQEWQGEVLIRLRIGADQKMKGVEIGASSGHEMLDEKAREAVSKAKPLVKVPDRLAGKEFIAEVRVIFKIDN